MARGKLCSTAQVLAAAELPDCMGGPGIYAEVSAGSCITVPEETVRASARGRGAALGPLCWMPPTCRPLCWQRAIATAALLGGPGAECGAAAKQQSAGVASCAEAPSNLPLGFQPRHSDGQKC
mmetsp:Transcript_8037/g.14996  ORF Transcript_8037/g.14996 Transcript_8037/m.14996 type:complete len:123 (+) Transcript_8037:1229-1597(+)